MVKFIKSTIIGFSVLLIGSYAYSAPTTSMSRQASFSPLTTILSSDVNSELNHIDNQFNNHSHNDINQLGNVVSGTWNSTVISTQFGGTGKDFSSVSSASIIYFSGVGTMSTLGPGASGQVLSVNDTGTAIKYIDQSNGAKDMISRGFEASASYLKTNVTVYSGTLYHGTTYVNVATNSTLVTTTASDYASGSVVDYSGGAGWNYIGVSSSASATNKGVFFLGTLAPQYSDTTGNTDGTKIYTKIGTSYYRVLGAIRQNTSNQSTFGQYQVGNNINYEDFTLAKVLSNAGTGGITVWASQSCSSFVPSCSTLVKIGGNSTGGALINWRFRTTGTNSSGYCTFGMPASQVNGGGIIVDVPTDSSQSIDYATNDANGLDAYVLGYKLNIR